jgi:8-oxo-dGTP pyrophosphatase MutT (NUDIX family)
MRGALTSGVMPREADRIGDVAGRATQPGLREVEARLRLRLDPLDDLHAISGAGDSDHDLNPEIVVPLDGLQPAAVLILLIARETGHTVLFTRRADHMRRHAGQIAFPGGRCEAGETPWAAALREAHEEVGIDPGGVRLLGLSTHFRTWTGFHITPVVGVIDTPGPLVLNPSEVAEAFEVPLAFLMDPANFERRRRDLPPGPPRWLYALTWRNWEIWGATAAMLHALQMRMEAAVAV